MYKKKKKKKFLKVPEKKKKKFNRDPSSNEIEEMAKTMCLKYPIIKSTCDDVS